MSNEELIKYANELIEKTKKLTDDEIGKEAVEEIKENKEKLINRFLTDKDNRKLAYFLAGSPGAGKTEFAKVMNKHSHIDIIDTDDIRRFCSRYSGAKAHLFQKASSKGVDILLDEAFKREHSFILDGNFSNFKMQELNIQRATKRNYEIQILFISRPLFIAKEYTKIRELKEGRKVLESVFYKKFYDCIDTIIKIQKQYNVELNIYDMHRAKSYIKVTDFKSFIEDNCIPELKKDFEDKDKNIKNSNLQTLEQIEGADDML